MRLLLLVLVALIGLFPVVAQATVFKCTVSSDQENLGYITDLYVIDLDDTSGKLSVTDTLTRYSVGEPVDAEVSSRTDKKLVFNWSVFAVNGAGQAAKVNFRSTLFFGSGTFRVAAMLQGYAGDFEAWGTCDAYR